MATPVAVLGSGSFGTALAALAASRDHDVTLWARSPDVAEVIEREHRNPRYLTDIPLPPAVRATSDLAEALAGRELVILAVPSHGLRDVVGAARHLLADGAVLVSTVKGIEVDTGLLVHQILEEILEPEQAERVTYLSGPSFAREVALRKPTAVTVASRDETWAIGVQSSLASPWFRIYSHSDVVGVEVGGALKNVIALAVGICDGLEAGANGRAAVMTRGLAEITRLGVRLGANPVTFLGLSGVGDLVLTCTGDLSRNRQVGLALGRGRKLEEILAEMSQVAEGVRTTRATRSLARRLGVEMPITELVHRVLDGDVAPGDAVHLLMTRQLRSEVE